MNQAQFANVMGTHRSQVTRWIGRGMPVEPGGSIDPERAARWVHANVDPTQRIRSAQRAIRQWSDGGPARPPGTEHLDNSVDGAITAALPVLAYRVPAVAAALAAACGAPLKSCYALAWVLKLAVMNEVEDVLEKLNVPAPPGQNWDSASMWDPDEFAEPNWQELASAANEPVDVAAWEEHKRGLPFYERADVDGEPSGARD